VKETFKGKTAKKHVLVALGKYIENSGPGYNQGMKYVTDSKFKDVEVLLAEAGHKGSSLTTPGADPVLWTAFAHSFHPFRKRGSHVVYLVHENSPLSQRAGLAGRYLRYRDVISRLRNFGCVFVREGKGSHEIWRGPNQRTFPVPRHPGDFKKGTLSGILGQAGIQLGVKEFLQTGNAKVLP
jgi:predicted RNA binding protein YcfA (HicA-like mRNA interferase family)